LVDCCAKAIANNPALFSDEKLVESMPEELYDHCLLFKSDEPLQLPPQKQQKTITKSKSRSKKSSSKRKR